MLLLAVLWLAIVAERDFARCMRVSSACANAKPNDALAVVEQAVRLLAKLEPDYSRVRPLHAYRRLEGGRTRSCREEFRRIDLLGLPIEGCP